MQPSSCISDKGDVLAEEFYQRVMRITGKTEIPYLVGGTYAFTSYTGIVRGTKDLDLFVHPRDIERMIEAIDAAGYKTEITSSHWLGKIFSGEYFIDIIFGSDNGMNEVDNEWFVHARESTILGMPVKLCPPEEIIWSKAFVMERERYDGADIAHLLHACSETIDWQRLLDRFGPHWHVLFSHLILFCYIYPSERKRIPEWIIHRLSASLDNELKGPLPGNRICWGTLLSKTQYLFDISCWGYQDARYRSHPLP